MYELNKLHFQGVVFDVKVKYFETREDALEEEKFLKSGKGRERLSFLLKQTMKIRAGSSTG